ncbi:MAG: isoleucine--tRNA ligase, partial [Chloroflexi bacterium]|nr:isoleucine--tRNA ligase [Chloroflexota bacterium]
MFREVSNKIRFPQMEENILQFWNKHGIFQKSLELRQGAPPFVFYEGPPTANGQPHAGHVLPRLIKDFFCRYKTMRGYYVARKAGWDTHGLPVELEIEKELGLNSKAEIERYGIAAFNQRCKESVFRYVRDWEQLTKRIGFWIDMEHAYVTFTKEYVESLWWCLRQIWDKGLLYQDYKVVPHCPRCGTSLSSHELALGYGEVEDPSVYVRFLLSLGQDLGLPAHPGPLSFLVWTTTPWTLPANVALAIHPSLEYVVAEKAEERFILARDLVESALGSDATIVASLPTERLIGAHYQPLFTFLTPDKDCYRVVPGDFVSAEEGTGIVHIAPAFGADDLKMAREHDLPILHTVDPQGHFIEAVSPWKGVFVKDADQGITQDLDQRGLLYRAERVRHAYPFCWRCETPLLYYAKSTWFIRSTAVREELLRNNELINWYPEHLKHGRFGNWLEGVMDWALSRERYWGTPLNIWTCQSCSHHHCVGSIAELEAMAIDATPIRVGEQGQPDLHRPYVDNVLLRCPQCGGEMRRVPEVIDAWFDSGAMPVAQWHYPFENEQQFWHNFPGDFICEAVDQTRGWFYTLHNVATTIFDKPAFKNVVVTEFGTDEQGQKMSKHKGNVVDPLPILDGPGADALRWYTYSVAHPWYPRRFGMEVVTEALRRFLIPLWNTYSFFVTYANIDGFDPGRDTVPPSQRAPLDRWALARLHETAEQVTQLLDNYDVTNATRSLERFVDDLSNWYVRRSRRRFWKSENDLDKKSAHSTLYDCLKTLSGLLAPFTPFTAEAIYQNLVRSVNPGAPLSVHLTDFPAGDRSLINEELLRDTEVVIEAIRLG